MSAIAPAAPKATSTSYSELRRHEHRKMELTMVDGNLVGNRRSVDAGVSARLYEGGYWGFASAPGSGESGMAAVTDLARRNARAMSKFGARKPLELPRGTYRGEHEYRGRAPLTDAECVDRLQQLRAWCARRFPELKSTRFVLGEEHHRKHVTTSSGTDAVATIHRSLLYVTFTAQGDDGKPVELLERLSAKGNLGDLDWSLEQMEPRLEEMHGHLQAKRHAVAPRGGMHHVVMAPQLAGILAHEAMGHPCEADLVLAGSVTGDLVGKRVASELVTMVDFAHSYNGAETMVPVYCDDEGTPGRDAILIDRGVLTDFMSSQQTAARLGIAATGNARAYAPSDEPLVRMRNTAILPGRDKLQDMIAGIDEGYLLLRPGNGQADSTTEFMFAILLGYEIREGKLGRAIRDTTISGSAIKALQSVDAVSDDMMWSAGGYCGKKQVMIVSMGGPAIRARVHVGGE